MQDRTFIRRSRGSGDERRPMLIAAALAAMLAQSPPDESSIVVRGSRWAPFISPMGEPFRAHSPGDDTLALWFAQADRDRDGTITAVELVADADRFFAALDSDKDGTIGPDEITRYEWQVAPDIQVMAKARPEPGAPPMAPGKKQRREKRPDSLQGAARYALLNMPQPVAAADTDFDRAITRSEFRAAASARFALLDTLGSGRLALQQLRQALIDARAKKPSKSGVKERDKRIGNPMPPTGQ